MSNDWKQNRQRRATVKAELSTFDREKRSVRAILATDAWIKGPWGPERLSMAPNAINFERADIGLPWHDDHGPHVPGSTGARIGVVDDIDVLGGEMTGRLRASRNEPGEAALRDIEDRIITHVSIGYRIEDAQPTEQGLFITKWTPLEVSTPSVVADPNATIQRSMSMEKDKPTPAPSEAEITQRVREQVVGTVRAIHQAFAPFPAAHSLRDQALEQGWDLQRANTELLTFLGKQQRPTPQGPDVVAGETDMEKFCRGAQEAIECRAMLYDDEKRRTVQRSNPMFGLSLRELAREYLRLAGGQVPGDPYQAVGRAFTRAGIISHTTSDFANILVDAANKAVQIGYEEAAETYEPWTRAGSLSDFRIHHNVKLSTFSDLEERNENGEFTYGTFSDFKETNQLKNRGRLFSITREAIINDDLNIFSDAPRGMGRAARRKVGDLVYAVLSTNAAMSDGNALFSAAHANYVAAGSGAVPSVDTLNAAYTAMATQTDPAGNTIQNVLPQYIITAHALRGTVDALLASVQNPAEGVTTAFSERNVWFGRLTPVYDSRIDADDAAKWYLATNPTGFDTIQVGYLNGIVEPRLERMEGFTVDGVILKVAHDCGVAPMDWRGLYHNDGN